jgi:hypothetical protein
VSPITARRLATAFALIAVSLLASTAVVAGDSSVIGIGDRIVTLDAGQTLSDVVAVTVGPFGTITLPRIRTVLAAGLTVDQLDQILKLHGRTVGFVARHADRTLGLIELFRSGRAPSRMDPDMPKHRDPRLGCPTCS